MNIFLSSLRIRAHLSWTLENRKTSPCSPPAPNLLHVLPSWMVGWHNLCNPDWLYHSVRISSYVFVCLHTQVFLRILSRNKIHLQKCAVTQSLNLASSSHISGCSIFAIFHFDKGNCKMLDWVSVTFPNNIYRHTCYCESSV